MFSAYLSRINIIRTLALLFFIMPVLSFFSGLYAAEPITAAAIYRPNPAFLDEVRTQCGSGADSFDTCFLKMLGKAGATKGAVDFARLIDEPGFMTKFKKVGPVDIAFTDLPFRANENSGVYLVNGTPKVVNIDDLSAITGPMLEKNPRYMALKKKYPDIGLFMGERTSGSIRTARLKDGKLQFTVLYRLTTGCRACEDVGTARIGFYFDRKGTFEGRKLIDVLPAK